MSILATSTSITEASKKAPEMILDQVPYIYYPVQFWKDKNRGNVPALINSGSKINAMTSAYATKLGFKVQKTNVRAQKIDGSLLATYRMVIAAFPILYKFGRACFFQESFLLVIASLEVILIIPFLIFSNTDIQFAEKELTWKFYLTKKALPNTQRIKLINKKDLAKAALDKEFITFVVQITALEALLLGMTIHLSQAA